MKRITESELQSWGIAALRIMVGAVLLAHGGQKLIAFGIDGTAGFFAMPAFRSRCCRRCCRSAPNSWAAWL